MRVGKVREPQGGRPETGLGWPREMRARPMERGRQPAKETCILLGSYTNSGSCSNPTSSLALAFLICKVRTVTGWASLLTIVV